MDYEKLDAWKACHALVMAVFDATKGKGDRDRDLIWQLQGHAVRAAAKVSYGCGTRNKKMFLTSMQRATGYLSSFSYYLALARVLSVLPDPVCTRLDALRGRSSFYAWQLLESLIAPKRRGNSNPLD